MNLILYISTRLDVRKHGHVVHTIKDCEFTNSPEWIMSQDVPYTYEASIIRLYAKLDIADIHQIMRQSGWLVHQGTLAPKKIASQKIESNNFAGNNASKNRM